MTYAVFILRRAQKEVEQLPREAYERVRDAIYLLAKIRVPRDARSLRDVMVGAFVSEIIVSFTRLTTSSKL